MHNYEVRQSKVLMKTPDKYLAKNEDNEVAFTPYVYEIHGSVLYMHCEMEEKECSNKFFKSPTLAEVEEYAKNAKEGESKILVPKCKDCGANMKPHSMFFDESYSERYYRRDTV